MVSTRYTVHRAAAARSSRFHAPSTSNAKSGRGGGCRLASMLTNPCAVHYSRRQWHPQADEATGWGGRAGLEFQAHHANCKLEWTAAAARRGCNVTCLVCRPSLPADILSPDESGQHRTGSSSRRIGSICFPAYARLCTFCCRLLERCCDDSSPLQSRIHRRDFEDRMTHSFVMLVHLSVRTGSDMVVVA